MQSEPGAKLLGETELSWFILRRLGDSVLAPQFRKKLVSLLLFD
jgi:hypothetical protein